VEPGLEISDAIVDYDAETLQRRPVRKADALARLGPRGRRIAATLPAQGGYLDPDAVDDVLVRAHLELQRLHEEFQIARLLRAILAPLCAAVRAAQPDRPLRVVDVGCGIGYVIRWLTATGGLGSDVELVGADGNAALVRAAGRLAARESLACRFVHANAFRLDQPAAIYVSTGVLHHFRGDALASFFGEQARSAALAMVHLDIRPTWAAPLGAFIFHQARMRVRLARHDGYLSAVRAHPAPVLIAAMHAGAPGLWHAMIDGRVPVLPLLSIMHAAVSLRRELVAPFLDRAPPRLRAKIEAAS
jgi:SAM-dependent methyltransferase